MKVTQCTSCKAAIVFATIQSTGKSMPFDAVPDSDGKFYVTEDARAVHVESPIELASQCRRLGGRKYTSHFATCPNTKQHRSSDSLPLFADTKE